MVGLVNAGRNVVDAGSYFLLEVLYTSLPEFEERFPTPETRVGAVANLWTQRLNLLLRRMVTQDAVVIVPP